MLVGSYPFEDPTDPRNSWKTIQVEHIFKIFACFLYKPLVARAQPFLVGSLQRVLGVQYSIPDDTQISPECGHLISRIFVFDPAEVIYIF